VISYFEKRQPTSTLMFVSTIQHGCTTQQIPSDNSSARIMNVTTSGRVKCSLVYSKKKENTATNV